MVSADAETSAFFARSYFGEWLQWIRDNAGEDPAATALSAWFESEEQMMRAALLEYARARGRGGDVNVLDVGCGFGHHIIELLKLHTSWRATGVDSDRVMIEAARRGAEQARVAARANFILGDASLLGERSNEEFDCAFCLNTFGNFTEVSQERLLRRLREMIRPGGWLLLSAYSDRAEEVRIASYEAVGLLVRVDGPRVVASAGLRSEAFAPQRLQELLCAHGFAPVRDLKEVGEVGLFATFKCPDHR